MPKKSFKVFIRKNTGKMNSKIIFVHEKVDFGFQFLITRLPYCTNSTLCNATATVVENKMVEEPKAYEGVRRCIVSAPNILFNNIIVNYE